MYYNEVLKKQYLEIKEIENINAKKTIDVLFKRVAPFEERIDKDLYNFSTKEIVEFYKSLCTPSLDSLMIMNNQFKLYTAYALANSLVTDSQNHYEEMTNTILNNCINKSLAEAKIITREELLHILRSSDVENVSDRFLSLALFEGICGKEACEFFDLTLDKFDLENQIVHLSTGRELKVSRQLIDWAIESAETYECNNSLSNIDIKYAQWDERIIKVNYNSNKEKQNSAGYYRVLSRRLNKIIELTNCPAFGLGSLLESGRLEMIKKMNDGSRSIRSILYDKDVVYRYGAIKSGTRYMLKYGLEE